MSSAVLHLIYCVSSHSHILTLKRENILLQASNCNVISENVVQYTWCLTGDCNEIIPSCFSEEHSIVFTQVVFHNLLNGCFFLV